MSRFPRDWDVKELSEVAIIQTGLAKGKNNINDPVTLPYLRVANVQDGYLDLSDIKQIQVARSELDRYRLKPNDVLLTEGGDLDKLGRGHVWAGQIDPCLHQNHVFVVRTDERRLRPKFFAALASCRYGRKYFLNCAKQTTNLASINSSQLKAFPVLLPPITEQDELLQLLGSWSVCIEKTERLIHAKKQKKRGLLQRLLTGKRRFGDYKSCAWQTFTLGEILSPRVVLQPKRNGLPLYSLTIETGLTPKTDRYDREALVRNKETKLYKVVGPNDIVFNPSNLRWGAIGISRESGEVLVSPIYEALYSKEPNRFSSDFLYHYLSSPRQIAIFASRTEGTLVERMAVKLGEFLELKICIPSSFEEQSWIATMLNTFDREIELVSQQLEALKRQKRALMDKLLTGQVRLNTTNQMI